MLKPVPAFFLLSCISIVCAAAFAQEAPADAGEHLFKQNCASCHSIAPGEKLVGPSLHAVMKGHPPRKTPDQVRSMILNGKGTMPPFKSQLSSQDIEDLVAYLKAH